LRMINALEIPTEGTVYVNGKTYTSKDKKSQIEVRKQSGMVFQSYNLFPHKTALENVMEGLITVKKLKKDEARGKSLELLEKVGLTHVKDQRPHALSGGQQQRIGVVRALAAEQDIILMDEPFGALDPITRDTLQDLVKKLQQQLGKTFIFVTHDMDEAIKLADKICIMTNGQV
ncbi:ATP-binding cassette domain-containing protein, partial [Ligilactobacillus ruminis]